MPNRIKFACLFFLVAAMTVTTLAQSAHSPQAEAAPDAHVTRNNEEKPLTPKQQRAIALLDQLFPLTRDSKDQARRVRLQINIADVLWKYDEQRARQLFIEAFQSIATTSEQRQSESVAKATSSDGQQFQLYREVISRLASHDAEFARQLIESITPVAEPDKVHGRDGEDNQTRLRWELAQQLAKAKNGVVVEVPVTTVSGDTTQQPASMPEVEIDWAGELARQFPPDGQDGNTSSFGQLDSSRGANVETWHALLMGKFDSAMSLAEQAPDPAVRNQIGATARLQAAQDAINRGDFEAARRYASGISKPAQRIVVFIEIAQRLAKKNDLQGAFEALDDATKLTRQATDIADRVSGLLLIAGTVAQIDAPRGFDAMNDAIEAINHSEKLPKSQRQAAPAFDAALLDHAFAALTRADFERAWHLTQTIENSETAVTIQLAICQSVLAELSEPCLKCPEDARR